MIRLQRILAGMGANDKTVDVDVNIAFMVGMCVTQEARCAVSAVPFKAVARPPLGNSSQTYWDKVSLERLVDDDRTYSTNNFYLVLSCFNADIKWPWGKWTKFLVDWLFFEDGVTPPVVPLHSDSLPAASRGSAVAVRKFRDFAAMYLDGTGVFAPDGVFTQRAIAANKDLAAKSADVAAAARAAFAAAEALAVDATYAAAADADMADAPAAVAAPAPPAAAATTSQEGLQDIRDFFKPKKSSRREPVSPPKRPAQRPRSESTETAGPGPAESAEQLAERRAAAARATAAAEVAVQDIEHRIEDLQQRLAALGQDLVGAQKTLASARECERKF